MTTPSTTRTIIWHRYDDREQEPRWAQHKLITDGDKSIDRGVSDRFASFASSEPGTPVVRWVDGNRITSTPTVTVPRYAEDAIASARKACETVIAALRKLYPTANVHWYHYAAQNASVRWYNTVEIGEEYANESGETTDEQIIALAEAASATIAALASTEDKPVVAFDTSEIRTERAADTAATPSARAVLDDDDVAT